MRPAAAAVVFQEDDEEFNTYVAKSKSRRFVLVASDQTVTSEWRYLDADDLPVVVPEGELRARLTGR